MDKETYKACGYTEEEAEKCELLSDICEKVLTNISLVKEQNELLRKLLKETSK